MAKKVIMAVSMSGMEFSYAPGEVVEWPDYIADAMLADGRANPYGGDANDKKDSKGSDSAGKRATITKRSKSPSEG
jgi:hypothetical protein